MDDIACPLCGYNLRGLAEPRCPECGYQFDWSEMLDVRRRKHPFLYEQQSGIAAGAFVRTAAASYRPRRFWQILHPAQPASLRRLLLYWLIGAAILAMALEAGVLIVRAEQAAPYVGWRGGPPSAAWNLVEALDLYLSYGWVVQDTIRWVLFPLLWPWVTFASLLVFRISMRRARIRNVHMLRCALYSGDGLAFLPWPIAGIVACAVFWAVQAGAKAYTALALALAIAAWIDSSRRLAIALASYLQFDWPRATMLASQIIVLLVFANVHVTREHIYR